MFTNVMMQMYNQKKQEGTQVKELFGNTRKSNFYEYPKFDYSSIKLELQMSLVKNINSRRKKGLLGDNEGNQRMSSGEADDQNGGNDKDKKWEIKQGQGEQMIPIMEGMEGDIGSRHKSQSSSNQDSKMYKPQIKSSLAPFIQSMQNPYDRHANSKMMKQKFDNFQYNDRMRNIAALVQNNKINYDTNLKTGSALGSDAKRAYSQVKHNNYTNKPYASEISFQPRQQSRQPQKPVNFIESFLPNKNNTNRNFGMALNVSDVLKYTLGDMRQRDRGVKPTPAKNPFVRVPVKFSESLNDFYKS